jgi:hypothetical protein
MWVPAGTYDLQAKSPDWYISPDDSESLYPFKNIVIRDGQCADVEILRDALDALTLPHAELANLTARLRHFRYPAPDGTSENAWHHYLSRPPEARCFS